MNQNTSTVSKLNKLIAGLVAGLVFVIPSFFLTTTNEYFDFNKQYLFVSVTAVMALLWVAKMLVEKKFSYVKSPLDLPLLGLLVAFGMSTLTSLDKTSSIFGSYGRWFPGFSGIFALYLFYYIVSTNIDSAKKVRTLLYTVTAGTALPALMGLVNYAGLVVPFINLINQKGFLLSGTSTSLAITALLGTALSALLIPSVKSPIKKMAFALILLVDFMALMVFGGLVYILVAGLIVGLSYGKLASDSIAKSKAYIFPVLGAVLALSALYFVVPQTRSLLQRDYPRETLPSARESWIVASTTVRDFPIFGSGVSTFYLNYPRYRTIDQNTTPTWNVNFDKPANELFNILSTMGIFGLGAYALFFVVVIKLILRTTKVKDAYRELSVILSAGVAILLASMFLTYAGFQTMFLLTTLLALLTTESALNSNKHWAKVANVSLETKANQEAVMVETQLIYKKEVFQYIASLPIVALAVFGMYQVYLQYMPEVFLRKAGLAANNQNINASYDYQVKAIAINPTRSYYHRMYANTNLILAQALSTKQELTDQEKTAAQNLLAQALRNIKFATENLNPLDSANWVARAQLYRFLMPIAKDADQFAVQAYNNAIQLDPTNPMLRVELGGIYYGKEDYLSAGNLFKQAVNLKSDYANARYNLAHALIKLKAFSDAKTELEVVQGLVEQDGNDYKLVASDLETVSKELATVAGAQTETKPSVQAIEQTGKEQPEPAPQEPLRKPDLAPTAEQDLKTELEQNP